MKKIKPRQPQIYSSLELAESLNKAPSILKSHIKNLEEQIHKLSEIGLALSREKDMNRLL
ncbi:MAG: hypothetical protein V3S22_04060 [Candidatus Neomarinimicrobiota bacterium]